MTDTEVSARPDADVRDGSLDDVLASLTLRRALVAFAVTAIVLFALSVVVGFVAAGGTHPASAQVEAPNGTTLTIEQPSGGEDFDWEIAAVFGTAVGTTLLALVTGLLAVGTWKDVRASQAMVELTRNEQNERIRPVVIGSVAGVTITSDTDDRISAATVKVGLMNVGGGPAVRVSVAVSWTGPAPEVSEGVFRADGKILRALAPGEKMVVPVEMRGDVQKLFFDRADLQVVGSYKDRLGNEAGWISDWSKEDTILPPPSDESLMRIEPPIEVETDDDLRIY